MTDKDLFNKVRGYLPEGKLPLIEEAYRFASESHAGQVRKSGEPYVEHPLQTAMIVASLHLDADSIAAALLHDVPEDCDISLDIIEEKFGTEIRNLVDGATKISKITEMNPEGTAVGQTQVEYLRKMLFAMSRDIRVVFIQLADRLHNMRTLKPLPKEKRTLIAQETMDIYAPLAHRLGMSKMKQELEDLSFYSSCLSHHRYRSEVTAECPSPKLLRSPSRGFSTVQIVYFRQPRTSSSALIPSLPIPPGLA